ncbi:C2H2-like zinc finger protein [Hibiscus syriacus]|uniref:C2H2-like zinc finger protein n=1 Tax=Hibiscus syriacus TaxID=106335 RepID=A0A6A2ZTV5_HIBSY|nr:DNA-directed RNA polymerase III subunit RPC5-like [Hibiscus syriacus]KAE8695344.1 C2H2-like zinc finger protein [Hibiscus syriacus]
MDLDDLGELDGSSQVNTRTTKFAPKSSKFAPKLKPTSKPKREPSSKQDPEDSEPKPQPPPPPPAELVSKKKENEDEDLKPPVVAELKAEQPISNGAVKMEIDGETKDDEILSEANRDEDQEKEDDEDMVVREIDVFFTPSIGADAQLYVLQYPLRPCWRPYELEERCEEVRVKTASGEVEIDMSVDVDSTNYDSESDKKMKMTKQTLSPSWLPSRPTGYAVGVLMGDKLHLNPIHAVVQLRPSLEHLNSGVSKRKSTVAANAEATVKVEVQNDGKEAGPSAKQNKKIQSPAEQKAEDKECWVPLKYHSSKSDFSAQYLNRMMAEQSCPIEFTMSPHDYVDSLCPLPSSSNKSQGPSRRFLLSIPLEERLKTLLTKGPSLHRFSALRSYAEDVPIEEFFKVLQKHALLVQGLWVPKSSLLFPEDPSKSLARDYVLLLFSKNPLISSSEIDVLSTSRKEEVKSILKILAVERKAFKDWKLKWDADDKFKKQYPDIVKKQENIWKAGEQNVISHICRGARGGPSRTKPGTVIKQEKTMNSDKVARKGAPGAQAGRTMSDETREAIPKALKKVFQTYKVCSLQLIRKGLRDLALSESTLPKADARLVVKAAFGADAPEHELQEVVSQVAVELPRGLFVMKSSQENPEYDPLREVVINLLRVKEKLKKADVEAAALLSLKRKITNNEYNKVMSDFCEYKGNSWVLKSGDGKPI